MFSASSARFLHSYGLGAKIVSWDDDGKGFQKKERRLMRASDLKKYRRVLLTRKQEIEGGPERPTVADETMRTGDWVDHSSQENDLHINLALKQTDTKLVRAIDDALQRVDGGTFGTCLDCEEVIPQARLDAVPWTRVCVDCKEKQD